MCIERLALLTLACSLSAFAETLSIPPDVSSLVQLEPNTRLFRKTPPTNEESKKFYRLAGLSRHEVILAVGHPSDVIRFDDGTEVWWYEWDFPAMVNFRDGCAGGAGFGYQSYVIPSPTLIEAE